MFTAVDSQHNIILANEYAGDRTCYCPGCREDLVFRQGMVNQAHFAHKCHSLCQTFSEGETRAHIEGKLLLFEWFKKEEIKVELEAYLPELNQRPDLLIKYKGRLIAIEYQCSPISKEKIKSRTEGYVRNDIKVIWILGEKLKVKRTLTSRHYDYLSLNKRGAFSLFQLDEKKRRMEVVKDIRCSIEGVTFTRSNISFSDSFSYVWSVYNHQCQSRSPVPLDRPKEEKTIYQLSYYKDDRARRFFELLYINGMNVVSLPDVVFYSVSEEWYIKTLSYQWKLLLFLWLKDFPSYQVLTVNRLSRKIEEWNKEEDIVFHYLPGIREDHKLSPFLQFLNHLCYKGYLCEAGDSKWVKSRVRI